ncbi:hypothetical protein D2962_16605 [Biomaibacter acetigenes]|uniref:Uncharacterized protein n=1 Tax=Biomaibacter acetigenes TaxID=2316383 RepID=A0A3G2R944_9FIRM|nr:PQQ-binding-like beta-propeller repeat protein [Biomaibacter acetigenes]AYO32000.1 hypothetical protein D2962_16605 [Biomaibacter acetigenes]
MRLPVVALGGRELKKQKPLLVGTDVRNLQQLLKRLGFFKTRIDGVFGDDTRHAVIQFQKVLGAKPSGIVDNALFNILHELEQGGAGKWLTIQKDFCHTGYSPVPVPFNLKVAGAKRIPGIIGFNSYTDILIAVARNGVWALDLKNFGILWQNRDLSPTAEASVMGSHIVVPSGNLVILDLYSGKIMKTVDAENITGSAVAGEGVIVAADGGSMQAFDERGNKLWQYKTGGVLCSPPALAYDLIYFASSDHYFYCLDRKGIPYWKTKTVDVISNPPSVWDGKVFAISRDAWFYAVNPLTGDIIWKKKFSDEEFIAPAFHRDFMLAVDARGTLLALSPQRAEIKWIKEFKVPPTTSPLLCPKTAFIGTENGLAALDLLTGKYTFHLEGKKITALIQTRFDIVAATEDEIAVLSPDF